MEVKTKMKKLISLLLALVMVFALVACAAKETPAANDAPAKSDASTETFRYAVLNLRRMAKSNGITLQLD